MFLGFGRGEEFGDAEWTDPQSAAIDSAVRSGLRQFYYPPLVDGASYEWSFLRPVRSLTLPAEAQSFELPDDFGGLDGKITIATSSTSYMPVLVVSEGVIRTCYSHSPTATGRPEKAAIRPLKGTTPQQGQRFELAVYPAADEEYTLQVPYYLLPSALDGSRPYAYGGMQHAETVLAACKMAAEETLDDVRGLWASKFRDLLAASISRDRQMKGQHLGYNRDLSDAPMRYRDRPVTVTFDGIEYA